VKPLVRVESVTSDSQYYVSPSDWPAGASDQDLSLAQILGVLDQFDEFYPIALDGLAKVTVAPSEPRPPAEPQP